MNALTTTNAGHEILCRFDAVKGKPVVFIATDMTDTEIRSWTGGAETEMAPMSYYHSTLPMSAADEEMLLKRFARQFSQKHVTLRHRLPRQMRTVQTRFAKSPPVFVTPPAPTPIAVTAEALAQSAGLPATLPPEVQALINQAVTMMQPAVPEVVAVSATPDAPKPARKRAAPPKRSSRKPAAKPINGVAVKSSRRAAGPSALEQKVEQLSALVAALMGKAEAEPTPTPPAE